MCLRIAEGLYILEKGIYVFSTEKVVVLLNNVL